MWLCTTAPICLSPTARLAHDGYRLRLNPSYDYSPRPDSEERQWLAPHLHHLLRQRVPALRAEGGAQGPYEGGSPRGHPLADGVRSSLERHIEAKMDFATFFAEAPAFHPNASLIKGVVCGVRVEDVEDPLMRKIRYVDKLVDELAKGKAMEKILR
nr:DUF2200 family protein [Pseudoxanthomonas sp. 3HH-4]